MGFFSRRIAKDKQVSQNNEHPAVQDFNNNPPITGGNAYETKYILKAQDSINKNTIPKLNLGKFRGKVEELTYNFYWLLQFHANYFVSLFPVKTKDSKLNELIYNCFRIHFLYGACGIYKKGDLMVGVYEKKTHINKWGEIEKIEFASLTDMLACKGVNDFKNVDTLLTINKNELKNYARLRTQSIGFGAIVTWMPFIKQQESLLKKIYMYSFVFHRKISYKAADLSTSTDELDAFFNEDIPFYLELDADVGTGNKFTTESINNGTSGGVSELETYYNFFIETYYHLLGRRINLDDKKERNISSEVNASQGNFDILHNVDKICKEDFLNDVTKITGIEWEPIEQESEVMFNDTKADIGRDDMNRSNND